MWCWPFRFVYCGELDWEGSARVHDVVWVPSGLGLVPYTQRMSGFSCGSFGLEGAYTVVVGDGSAGCPSGRQRGLPAGRLR